MEESNRSVYDKRMKSKLVPPLLPHSYFQNVTPKKQSHEMVGYARPPYKKEIKAAEKLLEGKEIQGNIIIYTGEMMKVKDTEGNVYKFTPEEWKKHIE